MTYRHWVIALAWAFLGAPGLAAQDAPPTPRPGPKLVVVGEESVELGKIFEREKIDAVFTLKNEGDADLEIKHVKSTCGCTTVKLSEKERIVPPGQTQDIVVTFDSRGRPGQQTKTVDVLTNDRDRPALTFRFTVLVETLFRTVPNDVYDFRNARRGERLARAIDVLPAKEEGELEIVSVNIPGVFLRHEVGELPGGGRGARITLTVDQDAPLGQMRQTAEITVRMGEVEETRDLPLTGAIMGDLIVRPDLVKLERPTIRGYYLRPVSVSSSSNAPFEVLSASAGPEFEVSVDRDENAGQYTIKLRIPENAPDGPRASFLDIRTDSLVQPLIRVPVFAYVAPRLNVEPPLVLLRPGESADSGKRRVALQNPDGADFSILEVKAASDLVKAIPVDRPDRPTGARYLEVSTNDPGATPGTETVVTVKTDLPGVETVEIPVIIEAAKAGRRSAQTE